MPDLKSVLHLISLAYALSLFATTAHADINTGRALWRVFDARHMGTADITRDAQFDERGLLYAANARGLLSFDGTGWRLATTGSAPAAIHTILNLGDGAWLAGGPQILGTFSPTPLGTHGWQSHPNLAHDAAPFEDSVLSIIRHQNSTYVITDRNVFLMADDQLSSVAEGDLTGFSFEMPYEMSGPSLLVATTSGLLRIRGGKSTTIPPSPDWAAIVPVQAISNAAGNTLIVTRRSGVFTVSMDGDDLSMTPLWEVLPSALETQTVTAALQNEDGSFVLGTQTGAILHLNSDGSLITSLDERNGFKVGRIHALTTRADGALFAFFDEGSVWINLADPLRVWDSVNGLQGSVRALSLDDGAVFAGTNRGLYRTVSGHRMRAVAGVESTPIFTLNAFSRSNIKGHSSLLVGRKDGLFDYFNDQLRLISDTTPSAVFVSRTQPTRVALGTSDAITLFEFDRGDWVDLGVLGPKTASAVTDFTETPEGDLLAVLADNTVLRFVADQWLGDDQLDELVPVGTQTFSRKQRPNAHPTFASDGDDIHLFLPDAALTWDPRTERFSIDTDLATQFVEISSGVMPSWHSAARQNNALWLQSHAGSYMQNTDTSELTLLPSLTNGTRLFNSVLVNQASGSVLFATPDGITSLPVNWADLARDTKSLAKLSLRGITLEGVPFYGGEGPHPVISIASGLPSLTLDLGLLDWETSCHQSDLKIEFLQSARPVKSVPVNSTCSATLPATDLSNLAGTYTVRLTGEGEPLSTSLDLTIRTSTPWYTGATGPIGLALLVAGASIASGHKTRRVWPEPVRRYLAFLSGLFLCLAVTIKIDAAYQAESFASLVFWCVGLAATAFILPVYTEALMRLGGWRSTAAR